MWSIASTTKSTGTSGSGPPSTPTSGNHGGSMSRSFWISLKTSSGPSTLSISPVFDDPDHHAGAVDPPRHLGLAERASFSESCLVEQVGVVEAGGLVEHGLGEVPLYMPPAAMELTWCRRPARMRLATCTTWRVPSTLASCCASASAVMS